MVSSSVHGASSRHGAKLPGNELLLADIELLADGSPARGHGNDALPRAQTVLVCATHYGRGQALARDAGMVTTTLAVPVLLIIAALLG
jgi:hypothetical protein